MASELTKKKHVRIPMCRPSNGARQQRVRTQVYCCHVGLTDIAVPVICDGQYLGTLFSGQVLNARPTAEGFAYVQKTLAGQAHIDFAKLEAAYYQVQVVNSVQLAEMVRILELFRALHREFMETPGNHG